MGTHFGKLFDETADLALLAHGLTANSLRLFIWLMRTVRNGDQLSGRDAQSLASWADERGVYGDLSEIQVAVFSLKSASTIFNGNKTEASRQVSRLVNCDILSKVGKPARGHAQVYVLNPNKYTHGCVPNDDNSLNGFTSESVPNGVGYTSQSNGYTSVPEMVHITTPIGTHDESVNRDNATPIRTSLDNSIERGAASTALGAAAGRITDDELLKTNGTPEAAAHGAASSVPLCPSCGEPTERTNTYTPGHGARLYRCTSCLEEVWREAS